MNLEMFHDNNRYFLPLIFIGLVLMIYGLPYWGKAYYHYQVNAIKPLFFSDKATIQSIVLRPDWTYKVSVNTNKPVSVVVTNLNGEILNQSINNLTFKPLFTDLYFIKVLGSGFVLYGFDYGRLGVVPVPTNYLFFNSGLLIILLTILYYLLKPLSISFKRRLSVSDSLFYPLTGVLVFIILWAFKESFIQLIPRDNFTINSLILSGLVITTLLLLLSKRLKGVARVITSFFSGYLLLFTASIINLTIIPFELTMFSLLLLSLIGYYKVGNSEQLIIFLLALISSLSVRLLAYSIGVPVYFDNLLTIQSQNGLFMLLILMELFVISGVYFIIRGYYGKSISESLLNGFYSGVMFQAFLQILMAGTMI